MEDEKDKKINPLWIGLVGAVVVCALASVGYIEHVPIYNQLNAWKLIPEPETFTELYFDNASTLPRQALVNSPISFSFTIHNLEGATTTYPYRVYFEYPDEHRVTLTSGTVTLEEDASTSIPVSYQFLQSEEQGMVVVELTSLQQSIDFLLPDNN